MLESYSCLQGAQDFRDFFGGFDTHFEEVTVSSNGRVHRRTTTINSDGTRTVREDVSPDRGAADGFANSPFGAGGRFGAQSGRRLTPAEEVIQIADCTICVLQKQPACVPIHNVSD